MQGASMKSVNISQVDTVFANGSYPIEFLFFFEQKINSQRIRTALKNISASFWPLFGEYTAGQIVFKRYAESEHLREETTQDSFDLTTTPAALIEKYGLTHPGDRNKMFHLNIIRYTNGTVLIPRMNHLAGDGYSYFYFLMALAAVTRGFSIPFAAYVARFLFRPRHRRTVLKEFKFNLDTGPAAATVPDLLIESATISKRGVYQAIREVKVQSDIVVSTNDLLSAMVIKKLVLLRRNSFPGRVQLTIPVDVRRFIAEYGRTFIGNALLFALIHFDTEIISSSSVNKIAVAIRRSMPAITKVSYVQYLNGLEQVIRGGQVDKLKPFDPQLGVLVTNLSKLPADKLDFGSGPPGFIFPLTVGKNSAAVLSQGDHFLLRLVY
jgi:hypothetical protein